MEWVVKFHENFKAEFDQFDENVQDDLVSSALSLKKLGPQLGRPTVDTLKGSKYDNMKELRFRTMGGVWRVAFAFDPRRQAVLLVAGNKMGLSPMLFYKRLIKKADQRFSDYLKKSLWN